jgi:hypothetical protein
VLGAAQADPGGTEPASPSGIPGGVRVGVHPEPANGVCVTQEPVHGRDQRVAVGGDDIAGVQHGVADDGQLAIDDEAFSATHAGLAPCPGRRPPRGTSYRHGW